jgi:glucokinase
MCVLLVIGKGGVGEWFRIGIYNLIAILDPEIVVVGGGAITAGDLLLGPARTAVREKLEGVGHRTEVPIVSTVLGADAGLIGVALAAHELEGAR